MSWFKRKPRKREEPRLHPHNIGPMSREMLEKAKESSPKIKKTNKKLD